MFGAKNAVVLLIPRGRRIHHVDPRKRGSTLQRRNRKDGYQYDERWDGYVDDFGCDTFCRADAGDAHAQGVNSTSGRWTADCFSILLIKKSDHLVVSIRRHQWIGRYIGAGTQKRKNLDHRLVSSRRLNF